MHGLHGHELLGNVGVARSMTTYCVNDFGTRKKREENMTKLLVILRRKTN